MSSTTSRMFSEIKRQAAALSIKPSRRKLQGFYQQDRQSIETLSGPTFRTASGNVENLYATYRFSSYLHNSQYVLLLGWTTHTVHNCAGDVAGHNQSKTINMLKWLDKEAEIGILDYLQYSEIEEISPGMNKRNSIGSEKEVLLHRSTLWKFSLNKS